ncbi:MAG: twin-arginine translocase subunit TatC [Acidobacteria bacterium]|nr:twin-arginine translocase subunit TatC [Acidobacteriota bacterium]
MALVPFPSASPRPPDDDDDRHIHLTDPDPFDDDSAGARMSFLEHLDELRNRLIYSVYSLVAGCAVAFIFVNRIQEKIWMPLFNQLEGTKFMFTAGFEPFMLTMKIGALAGLMLAAPLIIYQVWLFIAPGLYAQEKKYAIPFVLFCTVFFALGAAFSHLVAFPWTWKFFLSWQTQYMEFRPAIGETFGLYVKMLLGFALIFQMPTVVFFLARMGVVTAGLLARNTKYAVLVIFIVAAVISPGTDVVSQALMAGPMLALYAISILIAWIVAPRRTADAA